jgi:hypothetical protein
MLEYRRLIPFRKSQPNSNPDVTNTGHGPALQVMNGVEICGGYCPPNFTPAHSPNISGPGNPVSLRSQTHMHLCTAALLASEAHPNKAWNVMPLVA